MDGLKWKDQLSQTLIELKQLLQEEGLVSAYEICSSGLVQGLLFLLCGSNDIPSRKRIKVLKQRINVFKKCFTVSNNYRVFLGVIFFSLCHSIFFFVLFYCDVKLIIRFVTI